MNIENVTISDWLIVTATIMGPIIAIQVQKSIEVWREKRNRKLWIFYNLMATRASRVSERHVEALNSIQLEYYSNVKGKAKLVKDSWAEYHSHLNQPSGESPAEVSRWHDKGDELFTNLLFEMSIYLGYDYNKIDIKKGSYSPMAHGNKQALQDFIALELAEVLSGKKPLKIQFDQNPQKIKNAKGK